MKTSAARVCLLSLLWLVTARLGADTDLTFQQAGVPDPNRANVNYMLNCQGCHGQSGSQSMDGAVPGLQNFVGNFLRVPGGREFLVQVPGSANAAISDAALAELLNWILLTQSRLQLPDDYQPFTEIEVAELRKNPLTDVASTRAALVRAIEQDSARR